MSTTDTFRERRDDMAPAVEDGGIQDRILVGPERASSPVRGSDDK